MCSDNFTCCHTEIEIADYLTHSQHTDTVLTSPSTDRYHCQLHDALRRGHVAKTSTTEGHVERTSTTEGHVARTDTTEGHVARTSTTEGHVARTNTTEGHVARTNTTEGHVARTNTTEGHVARTDITEGHVARTSTTEGHQFIEFFVHKIEEIRRSFDPYRPTPTNPVEFSGTAFAELQLVTEDFVKTVVQEMPQKSCDLDPIPTSALYDCLDEIIPIVTSIMNKPLSSGIVPQCFKHDLVKPLLIKASLDPNCLKHYRPVSNLPFLSKVLECIVLKQFLLQFQSAYRKCHSTETALLRVVNDLLQASDSGRVSILSLLDLSAALDTIDHNILITRLRSTFGCSGMVLDWFISYLSCRTQSVFVGHESTPSEMWSAAGFCSGTSSIYSVYTSFTCRYLPIWSFISFLCR